MKIMIINPNTTASMTEKMAQAARKVAAPGTELIATQPADGPVSIESHFDEAISVIGVLDTIREHQADAYVIACFGDPGLLAARELTAAPVLGIAEAAFHVASMISTRFSVVTTLARTGIIAEHLLDQYGFASHCRKVRATDLPVLALEEDNDSAYEHLYQECLLAQKEDQIGAIVLGCGGMADMAERLTEALGMPVIDGVTAAVKFAEALVGLNCYTSRFGDLAPPPAKPFIGRFEYLSS